MPFDPIPRAPAPSPAPQFVELHRPDDEALAQEAWQGLQARPAAVAPKFFYDRLGSRLFDAITELDEYYPTRTEAAIFERHGAAIAARVHEAIGRTPVLVDLGAGNGAKAARFLFDALAPRRYVAVDISVDFLRDALATLQRGHPQLPMLGVGLDFAHRLQLPAEAVEDGPALVFYPGSSIGNFAPAQAERLLGEAARVSQGGALLIGVDLVKPAELLQAAYDDALGVTAAFNLNLLRRLNRLLGANFELADWQHVAHWDTAGSRIEMLLQARRGLTVRCARGTREFAPGERILTEHSYKWTPEAFARLLQRAGWQAGPPWTDARGWFAVFLARSAR